MTKEIPWTLIISTLPTLVDAAGKLFKKADQPPSSLRDVHAADSREQLDAVVQRLEYLESLQTEQAKLLQQAIEQLQNVTVSSSVTAAKMNTALGLACAGLASALIAIVLALIV